jgi:hypothetical protein
VCSFVGGVLAAGGLSISYFAEDSTFLFISYGFLTGKKIFIFHKRKTNINNKENLKS